MLDVKGGGVDKSGRKENRSKSGACCWQWWRLWSRHTRFSACQTFSKTVRPCRGSKTVVYTLIFFSPFFPLEASVIIRICDNHRAAQTTLPGTVRDEANGDIFVSIVSFLCIITGHVPLLARATVLRSTLQACYSSDSLTLRSR